MGWKIGVIWGALICLVLGPGLTRAEEAAKPVSWDDLVSGGLGSNYRLPTEKPINLFGFVDQQNFKSVWVSVNGGDTVGIYQISSGVWSTTIGPFSPEELIVLTVSYNYSSPSPTPISPSMKIDPKRLMPDSSEAPFKQVSVSVTKMSSPTEADNLLEVVRVDLAEVVIPDTGQIGTFVTLNFYFGFVNSDPDPFLVAKKNSKGSWWYGAYGTYLRQRIAWTVGVGLSDFPGMENQDIKISETYLVGPSYRFNRYVSAMVGVAIAKNDYKERLDVDYYLGVSLDIAKVADLIDVVKTGLSKKPPSE